MKKIFILIAIAITALVQGQTNTTTINGAWNTSGNVVRPFDWLGTKNNEDLIFKTNNTQKMVLTKNGNLGIGTTFPLERLDVGGNLKFSGALMPNNTAGATGQALISAGAGVPPTWGSVQAPISVTAPITLTGATVGITTATTATNGQLLATDFTTFNNKLATANNGLTATGTLVELGGNLTKRTQIFQNGFNFEVVGGNVGINKFNPSQTLEVGGNILASGFLWSGDSRVRVGSGPDNPTSNGLWGNSGSGPAGDGNLTLAPRNLNLGNGSFIILGQNQSTTNKGNVLIQAGSGNGQIGDIDLLTFNPITGSQGIKILGANSFVGIGTENPTAKLEVAGQVKITGGAPALGKVLTSDATGLATWANVVVPTFDATINFSVNANPNTAGTTFNPNTPNSTTVIYVSTIDGSQWTYNGTAYITAPASADWKVTGNAGTNPLTQFVGTTDNVGLPFRTNNIIRQTITNTGNIGIGTTTPRLKLDVIGEIGIDAVGGYSRTWNYLNGVLKWTVGLRISNDYYIYREGVAGNVLVPLGNVGIGTTAPNAQLQLGNTVANRKIVLYEAANNDNQYYGLGINAGVLRYQIPAADNKHIFYAGTSATASNALMTIQGNGNVGIGTDAPTAKLHVIGSTKLEGSASNSGFIELQRTGQATRDAYIGYGGDGNGGIDINSEIATKPIKLTTANGNVLVSTGTGNVGIGTTAPTQKLHVIGNIIASGTITPSDKRLKSNIKDVVYGLKDLLKLKAVSYTKKFSLDKAEKGEVKEIGFIAQDLQKILPELVTENGDDKLLAVNYTSLIPILIKAIQEQQIEIELLKLKIK